MDRLYLEVLFFYITQFMKQTISKITINLLIFLFTSLSFFGQTSQEYQDSIKTEIRNLPSDSLRAKKYYAASLFALQRLNDLELSRLYLDSSMHYSQISGFTDSEAKCHFLYGLLERIDGNYDVALAHLDTNITYFENDSTNKAYAMFQVGVIYKLKGDYQNSLETYYEILRIFESKKDSFAMASTLNSIGNIYGDIDKYDEAIENYSRAKEIFIIKDKKRDVSNSYQNIGDMYLRKTDTLNARDNMERSLAIAQSINEDYAMANASNGLARTYLNSEPDKALEYYKEAESILERIEYNSLLVKVYRDLGHYFRDANDNTKAILYYNKALVLAEELDELPPKEGIFEGLSSIYESENQYKKAFNYQSKYILVKDSLLNKENLKSINLLQTQYETERKDKEIIQQQLQIEQTESELQEKKTQNNYIIGLAVFLFVASLLAWFVFQQRQKRKDQEIITLKREHQIKTLESLMEGEEKERLRIAKELHDGVNGDLSAIKYKLSSLLELNNTVIQEAITMIDNSYDQVRAISHNLVPPSLINFSLLEATQEYCNNLDAIHPIQIFYQQIGEVVSIPKKAEVSIFRIIQELVNNSIKHADASEITVQISCRDNMLQLTIEDNGKGFDKGKVMGAGIGLSNVESRVDYLEATMDLISNDQGTSWTIEIDTNKLDDN
ncbi:MAG: hypothetical protein DRI54_03535 [Bacteroidetes bacterium]|nr:MAG: hypothetical protein DRI54_03535 [Bacteroidota bacterium]